MIREHQELNATGYMPRNAGSCKQGDQVLSVEEHLSWSSHHMHNSMYFTIYKQIPLLVLLASLSSTQHKTVSSLSINGVYCKKENALEVYNQSERDLI